MLALILKSIYMNTIRKLPLVTLVGAGPGDPDLITVKALKAIQSADVILYDALVNPDLLDCAKSTCKFINVGKRAGKQYTCQDLINTAIVESANLHGHVVRLKGGDSFVFGRGHEEYEFVTSHGIPVNIIPGISSCISLPELEKVPVTKRGITESFWVITGTTKQGKLSRDIRLAARSSCTLVVLMGMRKIEEIRDEFLMLDKADTPIMIVQNGSLPDKKVVVSTIADILTKVKESSISTPAIIVIGEVVRLHAGFIQDFEFVHSAKQIVI